MERGGEFDLEREKEENCSQRDIFQERKGRQLAVERYEGDILVGSSNFSNPAAMNAHIADRDKMWPSGVVEYRFWRTFPRFVCTF